MRCVGCCVGTVTADRHSGFRSQMDIACELLKGWKVAYK